MPYARGTPLIGGGKDTDIEHVFVHDALTLGPRRRSTVLVVEDEEAPRQLLSLVLQREGYLVELATDGKAALEAISTLQPDVVLLDVMLPELNGLEVCRRVREDARVRLTPIIMVTGYDAEADRIQGLSAGADDFLAKPIIIAELLARVRSLARMKRYTDDLDSASAILTTLAEVIESRYGYSPGHCHRMANYAAAVGRTLRASDDEMQALYRGAFLHDIGMLAISDMILQNPGPLSNAEYETVKAHPTIGDALCANLRSLQSVRPIVRWHHERLDGSGYPDGLRGQEIPLVAQIVGVVEMYEALTTTRPYQERFKPNDALVLLHRHADRGWLSADVVQAMTRVIHTMYEQTAAPTEKLEPTIVN
jgi:putative two-component system response regulator